MTDTVFVNGVTLTDAGWFQDVNDPVYQQEANLKNSDYGGVCDGVTDDTAAWILAIASGLPIVFDGTSLVDEIIITSASARVIRGRSSKTSIIKLSGAGAQSKGIYTDNLASSTFINDIVLENFSVDMTNLTDDTSHFGIYLKHSFNNTLRNIKNLNQGGSNYGFGSGTALYTTEVTTCSFERIYLHGASGVDRVTTIKFFNLDSYYVNLENVTSIDFFGCTIQGAYAARFDFTVANKCTIWGGDIEGTVGIAFRFNGANCTDNQWHGVDFSGFSATTTSGTNTMTTSEGNGPTSFSTALASSYIATGRTKIHVGSVTSVSTSATTIYTNTQTSGPSVIDIFGDDGASGWIDRVVCITGGSGPVRVTTATLYGAPPTRTYTEVAGAIKLALGAGTHNVRAFPVEIS